MRSTLRTKERVQTALEERILATVEGVGGNTVTQMLRSTYQPYEEPALTGDGNGNVSTGVGREIYVRLLSDGRTVKAINYIAPLEEGLVVVVGTTQSMPNVLQVLRMSGVYGDIDTTHRVSEHGETHTYPGRDTVWIEGAQLIPFMVLPDPDNDFYVRVYGGIFLRRDGTFGVLSAQTLNLSSYAVSTGAKYLLVQFDDDGVISVLEGTLQDSKGQLNRTHIPTPTEHPLIAIQVYYGQTTFQRNRDVNDFVDPRFADGHQYVLRSGLSEWDTQADDSPTPSVTKWRIYFRADGLYYIDASGNTTGPLGTGSGSGGGIPAGSDGEIQFAYGGLFDADARFRYDKVLNNLFVGGEQVPAPTGMHNIHHTAPAGSSPGIFAWAWGTTPVGYMTFVKAYGTDAVPAAIGSGAGIGRVRMRGHDGVTYSPTQAELISKTVEPWSGSARGTKWELWVTPAGSTVMELVATVDDGGIDLVVGKEYTVGGVPLSAGSGFLAKTGLTDWDTQVSDPALPASGKYKLYFQNDGAGQYGLFYRQGDTFNIERVMTTPDDIQSWITSGQGMAWDADDQNFQPRDFILEESLSTPVTGNIPQYSSDDGVADSGVAIADVISGTNSYNVDCSGGTSDTYGVLGGLVNGSNTVFTVSAGAYISGTLKVYLNGQLQTQGTSEDWVETTPASGTFTFATAPLTGDIITVEYLEAASTTGNADTLDGQHASAFALDSEWITGWIGISDTWTRTGNHTFTVSGDVTTIYRPGTKVRYRDGGSDEYGIVHSSSYSAPNTTVTLFTNSDYAMAAATITDTFISYVENPEGWPFWFNWAPTVAASGSMTVTASTIEYSMFNVSGRTVFWKARVSSITLGGTAAAFVTLTPPCAIVTGGGFVVAIVDTANILGRGVIGTTLQFGRTDLSNWTLGSGRLILGDGFFNF